MNWPQLPVKTLYDLVGQSGICVVSNRTSWNCMSSKPSTDGVSNKLELVNIMIENLQWSDKWREELKGIFQGVI
jgi:hypothetical protein